MLKIRMSNHIFRVLLVQSIFLILTKAEYSGYDNATANHDLRELDRSRRSPQDELPDKLEAMIINENGKLIHLQWEKAGQTLANEHLPIWTAHKKGWKTYHQSKPNFMDSLMPLTRYHDLEQNSAVIYIESTSALWGAVDVTYSLNGIPLNLLHQCHKVGGPYVKINKVTDLHGTTVERPEPAKSVLDRFENCDDRRPLPSTGGKPKSRSGREVVTPEMHFNLGNLTNIRKRREENSEHYYVETLVLVEQYITKLYKDMYKKKYFVSLIRDQLLHFNFIDMLFAQLRKHGLNIHINVAGIIVEYDEGAFDSSTNYPMHEGIASRAERFFIRIPRYLEYFDLPFGKDSIDLIHVLTCDAEFIQPKDADHKILGMVQSGLNLYKTRQIYKDIFTVPITLTTFENFVQISAIGAREIAHALTITNDPLETETPGSNQCNSIMQECPICVNCLKWSSESVQQLREFTQHHKMRCFLLNYPRSLFPPGPRKNLSPYQQCQCYGYKSHGKKPNEGLQVSADGCAQRLQCKDPINAKSPDEPTAEQSLGELNLEESFDEPTILPLDGTPCGNDKVCWEEECVNV